MQQHLSAIYGELAIPPRRDLFGKNNIRCGSVDYPVAGIIGPGMRKSQQIKIYAGLSRFLQVEKGWFPKKTALLIFYENIKNGFLSLSTNRFWKPLTIQFLWPWPWRRLILPWTVWHRPEPCQKHLRDCRPAAGHRCWPGSDQKKYKTPGRPANMPDHRSRHLPWHPAPGRGLRVCQNRFREKRVWG